MRLFFQDKHGGIHLIETKLRGGWGWEIKLKGLKSKNGHNEQSFIFAIQSKFKLKNIIHKNLGSLRGAFYTQGQSLRGAF